MHHLPEALPQLLESPYRSAAGREVYTCMHSTGINVKKLKIERRQQLGMQARSCLDDVSMKEVVPGIFDDMSSCRHCFGDITPVYLTASTLRYLIVGL